MIEVNRGVLVIGLSNTILFGGEQTTELLMLDVASGQDFSFPLTEEQVEFLLGQVGIGGLLDIQEEADEPPTVAKKETEVGIDSRHAHVEEARAKLDGILNEHGAEDAKAGIDAFTSAEKTPQL